MDELLQKILEKIKNTQTDFIIFNDENKEIEIKEDNFHSIIQINSNKKIAYVDGGNLEIIRSPSLSLFFNRIYYTIYKNNKRVENKLIEFYTLITAINKDRIYFKTEYFFTKNKIKLKEYEFDSFDKTLISGGKRASISLIGNIIRRFSELSILNDIDADFIILDGSLEAKYVYENELIQNLKANVCGLSKTTELLTRNANSATAFISNLTKKPEWYYDLENKMYFLKLNKKSKYIFRFEALIMNNINEILSILKKNSTDPIFLGYPYGLIEADRFARVTNKEKEMLQLKIQMKFKDKFNLLKPYLNSMNAHDILDSIG